MLDGVSDRASHFVAFLEKLVCDVSADEALVRWSSDWPLGHADARILEEYLVGRSTGALDVSGRAATGADGRTLEGSAASEDVRLPPSVAPSTLVLDALFASAREGRTVPIS